MFVWFAMTKKATITQETTPAGIFLATITGVLVWLVALGVACGVGVLIGWGQGCY